MDLSPSCKHFSHKLACFLTLQIYHFRPNTSQFLIKLISGYIESNVPSFDNYIKSSPPYFSKCCECQTAQWHSIQTKHSPTWAVFKDVNGRVIQYCFIGTFLIVGHSSFLLGENIVSSEIFQE